MRFVDETKMLLSQKRLHRCMSKVPALADAAPKDGARPLQRHCVAAELVRCDEER